MRTKGKRSEFGPLMAIARQCAYTGHPGHAALRQRSEPVMAKGQKKSSREARKPKAEKPKPLNAANPSTKAGAIAGLEHMKRG
jgi:hypothetical protein